MKKKFYKWLFKKFYFRALRIENKYSREGNMQMINECIKLQNQLNFLKDELITGDIK